MASGRSVSPCHAGSSASRASRGPRRVFQRTADSDAVLAAAITACASSAPSDRTSPSAIQSGNELRSATSDGPSPAMRAGASDAMRRSSALTRPARAPPRPRGPGSDRASVTAWSTAAQSGVPSDAMISYVAMRRTSRTSGSMRSGFSAAPSMSQSSRRRICTVPKASRWACWRSRGSMRTRAHSAARARSAYAPSSTRRSTP